MEQKDSHAIQEFRDKVSKLLGRKLVRFTLFGSKLEGRDTPESDIDLLVLVEDEAFGFRDEILDLAFEVNLKHGVYLSPRILSLSTYNHPVWRLTPFLTQLRERSVAV